MFTDRVNSLLKISNLDDLRAHASNFPETIEPGQIWKAGDNYYDFHEGDWRTLDVSDEWVIDASNILDFEEFPVTIIFPRTFADRTKYRVEVNCIIFGQYIPKGYVTDGATTPRLTWPVFPPVDRYWFASLTHDKYLTDGDGWSRANHHFKVVLDALEIRKVRSFAMHKAVQLNGWFKVLFKGEPK